MLTRRNSLARASERGAMRWGDVVLLLAVGAVVLLVSLPRLREFALRENESDAQSLLQRLGEAWSQDAYAAESVRGLLEATPSMEQRLEDVELLQEGRLLRRHGYLFELRRTDAGVCAEAWPWEHGRTGLAAYRWTPEGLAATPNSEGGWSGVDRSAAPDLGGVEWRPVAHPR